MWFNLMIIIGMILALILIGFVSVYSKYNSFNNKLNTLNNFTSKFIECANSVLSEKRNGIKSDTYVDILNQSYNIQGLMGSVGLVDYYDPITRLLQRNCPIVINFVQLLPKSQYHTEEIMILQNCLHMRMGQFEKILNEIEKDVKNPLILLREGVQTIVVFPLTLLQWSGLLNYQTKYKIGNSMVVKFLSFIIVVIGLVSSIVTIVSGKQTIVDIVNFFK